MIPVLGGGSLVTVLIAHYRCETYLADAIRSVLSQDVPVSLVVIDDGSRDLRSLMEVRDEVADPRVTFLHSDMNFGQFALYNAVLPHVASPWLALQDADDVSLEGRFRAQLAACEAGADIVGSMVRVESGNGQPDGLLTLPEDVNRALRFRRRGGIFVGPTLFARTEFVRNLGGFDGSTRVGGDTDLVCRAVFLGRVLNLACPYYVYRQRADSLTGAADTGFGSATRRKYAGRLNRRYYSNRWSSWFGRSPQLQPPSSPTVTLRKLG